LFASHLTQLFREWLYCVSKLQFKVDSQNLKMDIETISHYDQHVSALTQRYEAANMSTIHELLLHHLPRGCSVLEIGCGSGRDAAFLFKNRYQVTAIDASANMIAAAQAHHPEMKDRFVQASMPLETTHPLLECKVHALVCIAMVMHIPNQDLFAFASQIRDLVLPGGILFLSFSMGRPDLLEDRDSQGRLYIERPSEELQLIFERLGFRWVAQHKNQDALHREIQWNTLVMERTSDRPSSLHEIETIIHHDRKFATYKLALLRALCEIAQTQHFRVKWLSNGIVSVPLGLVAERWLQYYWPLIELDDQDGRIVIPQQRGMEISRPIAFRKPMRRLIEQYRAHGGLSAFFHDYRAGTIPQEILPALDHAINTLARTIVKGPVTYAGGSLDNHPAYFGFQGNRSALGRCISPRSTHENLGEILVSAGAWREMCLIGHWIAESLILRWAELTHEISKRTVPIKDVLDRLLVLPETERDVQFARKVYANTPSLHCVWTDKPLTARFVVDHTVPFSIWHNNDLWNLVPAHGQTNMEKSDKLVTQDLLVASRDRIIHCWEMLKSQAEERFVTEISRSLLRGPYQTLNWKQAAFSGLIENVETLAIQRGLPRWEP